MRPLFSIAAWLAIVTGTAAQYDSVRVVTTTRIISKSDVPNEATFDNSILLQPATFIGGEGALTGYFTEAMNTMPVIEGAPAKGAVEVSFVVEPDGVVNEVRVTKGVHAEVDKHVLKAAVSMPNWK